MKLEWLGYRNDTRMAWLRWPGKLEGHPSLVLSLIPRVWDQWL